MKLYYWVRFKPTKEIISVLVFTIIVWVLNFITNYFHGTTLFYLFYQGLFGYGGCILLPLLWTTIKNKKPLKNIGITNKNMLKAILIGIFIGLISIIGRMQNIDLHFDDKSHFNIILIAMIFSSLYEEIFFRGYIQTTIEKLFGIIPAIIISALCFSFYHSAMNFIGFNFLELLNLFYVGIFFSITFRITKNILTSYIVNLPHAILTFYDNPIFIEYGNTFDIKSAIFSIMATILSLSTIIYIYIKRKKL